MRYLVESTTLFPQRLDYAYTKNKMLKQSGQLRTDCGGLKSTDYIKSEPVDIKTEPDDNFQESQVEQVVTPPNLISSVASPLIHQPPVSAKPSKQSKKQKVILEMQSLKCFLCNKIVALDYLSKHLLFGEVHCTKCSVSFRDCQDFKAWRISYKLGKSTCEHVLSYTRDPLQSVEWHLSNQYLENGTSSKSWLRDKPHHLRAFVSGMESLKDKLPWSEAVSKFTNGSNENQVIVKKPGRPRGRPRKRKNLVSQDNINSETNNSDLCDPEAHTIHDFKDSQNLGIISSKIDFENVASNENIVNSKESTLKKQGLLEMTSCDWTQKSSPTKPPVGSSSSSLKMSKESKRRKKSEWVSGLSKKKNSNPKARKSVDYLQTPVDGFYYIVQHAVKECPNCYALIKPSDFSINIVTFLMTALCQDCGLTIYIVHDPPDDSGPRVCIVTGDKKETISRRRRKSSEKTQVNVV